MPVREVKILVSSPGGVNSERALAFRVIKRLQREYVDQLKIIPGLWERLPLEAVAGFQDEIERIASPAGADIVVFILWSRLGTPLGPDFLKSDGTPYNSGTEYEFDVSLKAREQTGKPAILVYIRLSEQIQPGDRRGDRSLGVAYVKIGDTLLLLGHTTPAQEMYRKSLAIMQALGQAEPDNVQGRRDLSIAHDKLGNVGMELGDLKTAREYFEKGLELREQLARQDPDNALDQLRRLEDQGKLPPAKKVWLTTVEKEMNALPR